MKLRERKSGALLTRTRHNLVGIVDGVFSLVCDITDNCGSSQSVQRLINLTRVQEDQNINKSYENLVTLSSLADILNIEPATLALAEERLGELI